MRTLGLFFASVVLVGGMAVVSNAQTGGRYRYPHNINAREARQQKRIAEGIENGSLTPRETARLERNETKVNQLEAKLRQGGLSNSERGRLERDLNKTSGEIYRQKHDAQGRKP
jgi:hypothetical protein